MEYPHAIFSLDLLLRRFVVTKNQWFLHHYENVNMVAHTKEHFILGTQEWMIFNDSQVTLLKSRKSYSIKLDVCVSFSPSIYFPSIIFCPSVTSN